eukprot:TRINITY_DN5665_c2_g1_i1.p1 TRINITY_DN5665_c2_g1~~TRINITY_DN5665_c2_g1_i1.p1  ORF type:complete len:316 (+),score=131.32 TRINITY_DN5665_c2_g1_i1:245-1192(+)
MFFGFLGSSPKKTSNSSSPLFRDEEEITHESIHSLPSLSIFNRKSSDSIPIITKQEEELLERMSTSASSSRKNSISQSLVGFSFFNRDSSPSSSKSHSLLYSIEKGDSESVLNKLQNGEENATEEHWKAAITGNQCKIVSILLEHSDLSPSLDRNWAIKMSCKLGFESIVRMLLSDNRTDPSEGTSWAEKNEPLLNAAKMGHHRIVEMLLSHSKVDPSVDGCKALYEAALEGHYEVVKVLLADRRIDPCHSGQFCWEESNNALHIAQQKGHRNIVELLLNDHRVSKKEGNEQKTCSEQALGRIKDSPWQKRNWGY